MDTAKFNKIRAELAVIFQETIRIVQEGKYISPSGREVLLPSPSKMMEGTVFYENVPSVNHIPSNQVTEISVEDRDSIVAGKTLLDLGYNPVVLNMASRRNPGGGVLNGSRAQEESLFRRTNLFMSLYQFAGYASAYGLSMRPEQYPMNSDHGGIYTPNATVFRNCDSTWSLLEIPFNLSFVAVAAINRPSLNENGELVGSMRQGTINKMMSIFRIALLHGHDSIVLGAFGCGAFRNPPSEIAKLFHLVMEYPEFKNKFKKIVFAIMDDHNSGKEHNPNGNLKPFIDEF